MSIKIFDESDLKAFEDMLFRAFMRVVRVARKQGLIDDPLPSTAAAPEKASKPPAPIPPAPPEEIAAATLRTAETAFRISGSAQTVTPEPAPVFGRYMEREAPPPKKRRSVVDVCVTHSARPAGFIPLEEAAKLMGNGIALDRAKNLIGKWVLEKEIAAAIVTGEPASPRLPGRLVVSKDAVLARDKQRIANADILPGIVAMRRQRQNGTEAGK